MVPKDKGTHKLASVAYHFDHNKHRNIKASNHLVLGISCLGYHYPLMFRLYLRTKQANKLKNAGNSTAIFKSKLELAIEMLQAVQPIIPTEQPVTVLFDSWYASEDLLKWITRQGWQVVCAVKGNRNLTGEQLTQWHKRHKGKRYTHVKLRLADGRFRFYRTRSHTGCVKGLSEEVRIVISEKGKGAGRPKYFLSTDTSLSEKTILQHYQRRWSQEVDFWYVKQELGLSDYRLQNLEAIKKWHTVVYATLVMLY